VLTYQLEKRVIERPLGSGVFVRLSDDVKKCVVYLGTPDVRKGDARDMKPRGTGFLVRHGEPPATYIVTATHVAKHLKDRTFGVRMNRVDDGQADIDRLDYGEWFDHPDSLVDVSVMPYEIPEWADAAPFQKWFATEFKKKTKDFGSGDMAYIVGVYKFLYGKKRNMPAVHVGHIASMADGEEIMTRDWRVSKPEDADPVPIYGHLVQAPTMPGASGSPVFVRRSLYAPMLEFDQAGIKQTLNAWKYGSVWLLGLWHGVWGDASKLVMTPSGEVDVGMNMGIVIPADKILETLNRTELVEMRAAAAKKNIDPESIATPQADVGIDAGGGDEILRTMLNTPPAPHRKPKAKPAKRGRGGVSSK